MKDKAEVLMQVDQLTEVKDELTEQVVNARGTTLAGVCGQFFRIFIILFFALLLL